MSELALGSFLAIFMSTVSMLISIYVLSAWELSRRPKKSDAPVHPVDPRKIKLGKLYDQRKEAFEADDLEEAYGLIQEIEAIEDELSQENVQAMMKSAEEWTRRRKENWAKRGVRV